MSCQLWFCLILWVNFICDGCWVSSNKICITMEFGYKFHWALHLLEGENRAVIMQHLYQSRWSWESKSLDNHLLLQFYANMIEWMFNSLTLYLQWLDIDISIWSLLCNYYLDILIFVVCWFVCIYPGAMVASVAVNAKCLYYYVLLLESRRM